MSSGSKPLPELVRDSELETKFDSGRRTVHFFHDTPTTTRQEVWQREKKPIGRGAFGEVWLEKCVEGRETGEPSVRAVKVMRLIRHGEIRLEVSDYARELETLAKFSRRKYSRCFVQSYGWFQGTDKLCVALEYLPLGDLRSYLSTKGPGGRVPEAEVQQIAYQLVDGLRCMHREDFTHRDLKPDNILIKDRPPSGSWWVVLSDFGLSKRIASFQTGSSGLPGTDGFMAPEIFFSGEGPSTNYKAADIWSVGEILFRMVTGKPTFSNRGTMFSYYRRECDFPTNTLLECSLDVENGVPFIKNMMLADPAHRVDAVTALSGGWIAKQLKHHPGFDTAEGGDSNDFSHSDSSPVKSDESSAPEDGDQTGSANDGQRKDENILYPKRGAGQSHRPDFTSSAGSALTTSRNERTGHRRSKTDSGHHHPTRQTDRQGPKQGAVLNGVPIHLKRPEEETGTCDIAETSVGKKMLTLRPWGSGGNTNRLSPDQLRVSKFSLASILDFSKDDVPGDFTYIAGAFSSKSPSTLAALWDNGDGLGGVHIWDVEKGVITRMFAHKFRRKEKKTRQTGVDASGSWSSQLDRSCILFSADSQMIAYSHWPSSTIRVANLTTGHVTELRGHELPITLLAFSAPHKNTSNDCTVVLASASLDKTVRLWPFFENRPTATDEDWQVLHHSEPVVWVSFLPADDAPRPGPADATRFQILSISESRTQHHWRWRHQWEAVSYSMHMEPLPPAPGVVTAITDSQDGQWIAIGIWSAETRSAQLELGERNFLQPDVTFHIPPDYLRLDDHAAVDNISFLGSRDDEVAILAVSTVKSITICARKSGRRFISEILKIPKGRELSYPISPVALTSNCHYLSLFRHSQEIEFWDSAKLSSLYDIQCHVHRARFSSISPDGEYTVSITKDISPAASSIMIWSVREARPCLILRAEKKESDVYIHAVGFSADSELIGVLTDCCELYVWRVKTGEYVRMVQLQNDHPDVPRRKFVNYTECAILAPDLMSLACHFTYEVKEAGRSLTHYGISLRYRTNTDWTFGAGILLGTVPFDLARDKPHVPVGGLAFSHDGRFLAEISIDGVVTIWKISSGRSRIQTKIRTTVGTKADDADGEVCNYLSTSEGDRGPSAGVAFSQDDTKLAVYFNNTQDLQLWSLEDDKPALILRQTTGLLSGMLSGMLSGNLKRQVAGLESYPAPFISPDFTRCVIYSSKSDGVTLLSLKSKQVIQVLERHRHDRDRKYLSRTLVSFSPNSRLLISNSPYSHLTMKVWDAKTGAKLTEFGVSRVDGVFFWPDSRRVATTSREGTIRVFDAKTGECCRIFEGKGKDYVVKEEKEEDT